MISCVWPRGALEDESMSVIDDEDDDDEEEEDEEE